MRYIRANIQGGIEIGFDAATASLIAAQRSKGSRQTGTLEKGSHPGTGSITGYHTPKGLHHCRVKMKWNTRALVPQGSRAFLPVFKRSSRDSWFILARMADFSREKIAIQVECHGIGTHSPAPVSLTKK